MVYGAFQGAQFSKTSGNVYFVKIYSKSSDQLLLPLFFPALPECQRQLLRSDGIITNELGLWGWLTA